MYMKRSGWGGGLAGRGERLGRQFDQHESAPRDQYRLMLEPPFFFLFMAFCTI